MISVNLTSAASGTYEAARLAASRVKAPGKIHVVDTRNASLAQGQLAVLAAECAEAGIDVQTTLAAVESQVPHAATFAILRDLTFAERGGRLPGWVRTIAEALGLTPVICTTKEGKIGLSGTLFGKRNRIERFARFVARRAPQGPVEIGVGHAVCEDDALALEEYLKELIPDIRRIRVLGLSPAIGVHGGPRSLLVAIRPWLSAQDVADRAD